MNVHEYVERMERLGYLASFTQRHRVIRLQVFRLDGEEVGSEYSVLGKFSDPDLSRERLADRFYRHIGGPIRLWLRTPKH